MEANKRSSKVEENKQPFDIDRAIERIRDAVQPFPKAAMFELADDGFASPFEQLIAFIISIRTSDEVILPVALALFALGLACWLGNDGAWQVIGSFHWAALCSGPCLVVFPPRYKPLTP